MIDWEVLIDGGLFIDTECGGVKGLVINKGVVFVEGLFIVDGVFGQKTEDKLMQVKGVKEITLNDLA